MVRFTTKDDSATECSENDADRSSPSTSSSILCPTPLVEEEDDGEVMSKEARLKFDQIRSLLAVNHSTRNANSVSSACVHLKKRKLNELAVSTVMLLEDEISHWMRGISELEHMLAKSKEENDGEKNPTGSIGSDTSHVETRLVPDSMKSKVGVSVPERKSG